jgi:hypothetical protein
VHLIPRWTSMLDSGQPALLILVLVSNDGFLVVHDSCKNVLQFCGCLELEGNRQQKRQPPTSKNDAPSSVVGTYQSCLHICMKTYIDTLPSVTVSDCPLGLVQDSGRMIETQLHSSASKFTLKEGRSTHMKPVISSLNCVRCVTKKTTSSACGNPEPSGE